MKFLLFTGVALLAAALLLFLTGSVGAWLIRQHYPPAGRFVEVEGGRIQVRERPAAGNPADAPVVVVLHGASSNVQESWLGLGSRLPDRYRVIAIERPGHGWSDRPGGRSDASPAAQAQIVGQVLDKMEVRKAFLVGHSWSGGLITAFALAHPDRVSGLVVLSGATHPWLGEALSWYTRLGAVRFMGPLFTHMVVVPVGALLLDEGVKMVFWPQRPPPGFTQEAAVPLVMTPAPFQANAEDLNDLKQNLAEQSRRYGEIKVPTLIITGDQDTIVSPEVHSKPLSRQIAGSRLVVLHGVGHMPQYAEPQRVLGEIERFVDQVAAGQWNRTAAAAE